MKKLILSIFTSVIIASSITYLFDTFSKDRISSKILISTLHPSESVVLQLLNLKLQSNTLGDVLIFFSSKLNSKIYNTKNDCININEINNIVPLLFRNTKTQIKIEITSNDENSISKCKDFIYDEVNKENKRIIRYYRSILDVLNEEKSLFVEKKENENNINNLIEYYNSIQKEISDNTNIDIKEIQPTLLSILYSDLSKRDTIINVNELEELEYFKINYDRDVVQKKPNNYFLFVSFFTSIFLFFIVLIKINNNKALIIRSIDRFLS